VRSHSSARCADARRSPEFAAAIAAQITQQKAEKWAAMLSGVVRAGGKAGDAAAPPPPEPAAADAAAWGPRLDWESAPQPA
jgi:hypothetical protein